MRTKLDIYVFCYYHLVDTSTVGALVPESIILPVVSVLSLSRYLYRRSISSRGYHPPSSQCSIT